MVGRVVEIAEDGRHLAVSRGFLVVSEARTELGRVPLDDLTAVIGTGHGLTWSGNLALALAERNVPLVLCAPNKRPAAMVWPVEGNHRQTLRMWAQIEAPKPLRKRHWQALVKAKVEMQAAALEVRGKRGGALKALARKVRSGDPDNIEAQAARRYWPLLFGPDFRRNREGGGVNGLLNYGYTVLRAGTARAVMAAGLHPTLGLQHRGRGNPMGLVDDLMEPFRPLVDLLVARLCDGGVDEVTREAKTALAAVLVLDMQTVEGRTPVVTCLQRLAQSLALSLERQEGGLDLPTAPLPLEMAAAPVSQTTGGWGGGDDGVDADADAETEGEPGVS